ncbi:hypothetical protein [Corynebacterium liangguodongii]|uniref:Uncharacterized protein n=1 Tax=Corynebacterium liangguodongii TaxID=2079535 RepID=A0A2S0WDS5_9CORY|nr:hypothetical protein [Corynebacterium liangguodongii]AWB83812.1 hypothetical protein C3E79_04375 [Corynebacterium liangguodongii]PWB98933.1 hypothetical protein DF219_09065 [Corynebacterium liangguodongii]
MARPREDNVIYANFGARRRVSTPEEARHPGAEAPLRASAYSPAAMRLVNAAVRQTDPGRVKRGHLYAEGGHVLELTPRMGGCDGLVAGSQNEPFTVTIQLPARERADIQVALDMMARRAGSVARARAGEFDDDVLDILIAPDASSVRFLCSCPDPAAVCKHAVAVAEKLAELIDTRPETIFSMRSLTLASIENGVRLRAVSVARENSQVGSEFFWSGRDLPSLPEPDIAPMIADSDIDLLHRAMQSVSFTNIDQLRAVADIEDLYEELTSLDARE